MLYDGCYKMKKQDLEWIMEQIDNCYDKLTAVADVLYNLKEVIEKLGE